jgi:hypothetical protein
LFFGSPLPSISLSLIQRPLLFISRFMENGISAPQHGGTMREP